MLIYIYSKYADMRSSLRRLRLVGPDYRSIRFDQNVARDNQQKDERIATIHCARKLKMALIGPVVISILSQEPTRFAAAGGMLCYKPLEFTNRVYCWHKLGHFLTLRRFRAIIPLGIFRIASIGGGLGGRGIRLSPRHQHLTTTPPLART
eukprot:COSAG02_NODE_7512_length_2977_cov_16.470466_5_plen_150_part_00